VPKGAVIEYDPETRYGYIQMEDGTRIFAHHSEVLKPRNGMLTVGDTVIFDVYEVDENAVAANIRVVVSGKNTEG